VTNAQDVVSMLRRHYLPDGRPPGGILAAEIEAPDGRRRADAIWAPLTLSGGDLVGHEIKVARSDVLAELADPTKADPWMRYCTRWWLTVSDPKLVDGLDIPEVWGIMAPPSGRRTRSMTVIRDAPKRKVGDTGAAWRRVLAWYHYRTADEVSEARRDLSWKSQEVGLLEEQLRQRQLAGEGAAHPHALRVSKVLRGIEASGKRRDGVWLSGDELADDDVIAALLDLAQVRALTREARWKLERLITFAQEFRDPMADIETQLSALKMEANA